jgi:hypothetical protein
MRYEESGERMPFGENELHRRLLDLPFILVPGILQENVGMDLFEPSSR